MITRTTTVGTLKGYRYNLNTSNTNMAKSMTTVLTGRAFNTYAEDPALATRCFQLRSSFMRTKSQLTVNNSVWHKYDQAWQVKENISTDIYALSDDAVFADLIRGENGATASGRKALGQSMAAKAQSIVQKMNTRYGDNYIFAGADTLNVPFTWDGPRMNPSYLDPNTVLDPKDEKYAAAYQYMADPAKVADGVKYTNDISEALTEPVLNKDYDPDDPSKGGKYMAQVVTDPHQPTTDDEALALRVEVMNPSYKADTGFKYLKEDGTGTNNVEEAQHNALCYRGVPVDSMDPEDQRKLNYFVNSEKKYMDLGLGFKEENGEAVSSSVFDASLQGIYYLGNFGTEEVEVTMGEGDDAVKRTVTVPNNMVSIIQRMGEILQRCDEDDGHFASEEEEAEFKALAGKFEDTKGLLIQRWTELDTETGFLKDNTELLTETAETLNLQITELEDVDPAAAITEYMFARYAYDTALKVGNSILSQSLMDYIGL